jgi:membrane protease YdiL (CAAX protease family)
MSEQNLPPEPGDLPEADFQSLPEWSELEPATVSCWRCGKANGVALSQCLHCRAPLSESSAAIDMTPPVSGPMEPQVKLILAYMVMLLASVVYGWLIRFGFETDAAKQRLSQSERLTAMLVVEGVDLAILAVALLWIGRPPRLPRVSRSRRLAGWTLLLPTLLVLLLANLAYHWLIRDFLRLPEAQEDLTDGWLVSLLVICVQPAIVEELFFRYLSLGFLAPIAGAAGAVVISSVMFGVGHIFVPLSIPILIVVGLGLGWLRVLSGSMLVPMIAHFLHNAFILVLHQL